MWDVWSLNFKLEIYYMMYSSIELNSHEDYLSSLTHLILTKYLSLEMYNHMHTIKYFIS